MMQFFFNSARRGKINRERAPSPSWHCDPLSHPDIARMTPAELADLPLGNVRHKCS